MYTVIFDDDCKPELRPVSQFLCDLLGVHIQDTRWLVRRTRGFFDYSFSQEQAEQVAGYFYDQGIGCRIDFLDQVKILPPLKRVLSLAQDGDSVTFQSITGLPIAKLAWQDVVMVSIGFIPGPDFQGFRSQADFAHLPMIHEIGDASLEEELKEKLSTWATKKDRAYDTSMERRGFIYKGDIEKLNKEGMQGVVDVTDRMFSAHYRFLSSEFRYTSLGVELSQNSLANFDKLINVFIEKAMEAAFPPPSLAFLEKNDYWEALFENLEDFDQFNTWFLYKYFVEPARDEGGEGTAPVQTEEAVLPENNESAESFRKAELFPKEPVEGVQEGQVGGLGPQGGLRPQENGPESQSA